MTLESIVFAQTLSDTNPMKGDAINLSLLDPMLCSTSQDLLIPFITRTGLAGVVVVHVG